VAYFDSLTAQFFDSPARALHGAVPRDEPTSSGIPGAAEMITEVVVAAVSGALSDEIKAMIAAASRRGRSLLRWRATRRLRARREEVLNGRLPSVGPDEARRVEGRCVRLAIETGINKELADRVGMALFIVLSAGGGPAEEGDSHQGESPAR